MYFESEGANFWLQALMDLKHCGVEDILIACTDNLKGFTQAILNIFTVPLPVRTPSLNNLI